MIRDRNIDEILRLFSVSYCVTIARGKKGFNILPTDLVPQIEKEIHPTIDISFENLKENLNRCRIRTITYLTRRRDDHIVCMRILALSADNSDAARFELVHKSKSLKYGMKLRVLILQSAS
jgi:hypothetical protein